PQHGEAVPARQPDVEHHQVETAGQRMAQRQVTVVGADRGEAVGAQALLDERGDALLFLGDQDAGHVSVSSVMTKADTPPSVPRSSTRPWWPSTMALRMARPSAAPLVRVPRRDVPRRNRSKMTSASSGGMPGP